MYFEGAMAHGFSTDRWTTGRLAAAIEKQFGIRYDQDHVGRLMHKFGLRERRVRLRAGAVRSRRRMLRRQPFNEINGDEIRSGRVAIFAEDALERVGNLARRRVSFGCRENSRHQILGSARGGFEIRDACLPSLGVSRSPAVSRRLSICMRSFAGSMRKTGTRRCSSV